jgi:hypothetical protein
VSSPDTQSQASPSPKRAKTTELPFQHEPDSLPVGRGSVVESIDDSSGGDENRIDDSPTEAPVPKAARILRDGQGVFI